MFIRRQLINRLGVTARGNTSGNGRHGGGVQQIGRARPDRSRATDPDRSKTRNTRRKST